MFGDSKKSRVITERENVTVERAKMTEDYSSLEYDETTEEFWASADKVLFDSPYEIITKVLYANGFALNVENILASLDTMRIALKASTPAAQNETHFTVKTYTPGVHFKMPQKNAKGKLLQNFYSEIQAYEAELARLQQFEQADEADERKSQDQLKAENKKLKGMNDRLAAKIDELTHSLIVVRKEQAASSQAFAKAEKLPASMKTGKVAGVSMFERLISVKTGTHTHSVSMLSVDRIPKVGEPALLHLYNGMVTSALFYESAATTFAKELGQVLHRSEDAVKVKRSDRSEIIIKSHAEDERTMMNSLQTGEQILLQTYDNQIVKYEKFSGARQNLFCDLVNESIVKSQISDIAYEEFIANLEKTAEDNEAA